MQTSRIVPNTSLGVFPPLILICKVMKISLQGQQYALVGLFQGYQLILIILKDLDHVDNSEDHIDPLHQ